ncbi:MAG: choice-of-anchor D domain-containing protein [Planctomycetaceae bacterium]
MQYRLGMRRRSKRQLSVQSAAHHANRPVVVPTETLEDRTLLSVTMSVGDLALLAYNADNGSFQDHIALLALADVPDGSVVFLTDRGAIGTGLTAASGVESVATWTTSSVNAGDIIRIDLPNAVFVGTSYGSLSGTVTMDQTSGDQMLIYQTADNNSESAPTFIYGFNADNANHIDSGDPNGDGWEDSGQTIGNDDSELPTGLTAVTVSGAAGSALGLGTFHPDAATVGQLDNFIYSGPITATNRATWISRIHTFANWSARDSNVGINGDYNTQADGSFTNLASLTVIPPNTNPTLSVGNLNYTEGQNSGNPVAIDSVATASDANGDADWNGGSLTVQITANAEAADEISVAALGNITVNTGNGQISSSGTHFATATVNNAAVTNGATLTINFNSNATNARVQELVRAIAYRSTGTPGTSARTVTFTATDKNSGVGTDTATINVALAPDTTVTLNSGVLTITDTKGGTSADQIQVSYSGGTYTITDIGGLILDASAIPGSTGSGTATVTVPDTGVTGILIDALGGDDAVTISSLATGLTGGVTISGGTGTDTATWNTTTAVGSLNVTAETIDLDSGTVDTSSGNQTYNGAVRLGADTTLTAADVTFNGTVNSGGGFTGPQGVYQNVAGASDYQLVYDLPIGVSDNLHASVPYVVDNSASIANGSFNRIAYYLELDTGSGLQWVFVSADAFTTITSDIGVPSIAGSNKVFQEILSNMDVMSNVPGIVTGHSLSTGNIEFWPFDYGGNNVTGIPNASSTYDFGDQNAFAGQFGSMQIHNHDLDGAGPGNAGQTIFALNRFNATGTAHDIGIGTNPGSFPDWTAQSNAGIYTVKNLQILVSAGPAQSDLTINTSGDVDFNGVVGGTAQLGDVKITSTGSSVAIDAAFNAASLNIDPPGTITVSGPITTSGGAVNLQANNGVTLSGANADITTNGGALTIAADADTDGTGALTQDNAGSAIATGAGNVTVTASSVFLTGSTTTTGSGTVSMTTTETITLNSGSSLSTVDGNIDLNANPGGAVGSLNAVTIDGATVQATGTGAVTITGTGGTTAGIGVLVRASSSVSTQSGLLTLDGTAIAGGFGVFIDGSTVTSTTGTIDIDGTAGGTGTRYGVLIEGTTSVMSTSGDIDINGAVSATGSLGAGVFAEASSPSVITIQTGGTGSVTITGTATAGDNYGVRIGDNTATMTVAATGSGDLTFNGTGTGTRAGFHAQTHNTGTTTIGNPAATGSLTINSDTVTLVRAAGTGTLNVQGTGPLSFAPLTANTTIGLGGGTGTLNLDDTELGLLSNGFSSITFGGASSGDIDIDTATFNDPLNLVTGGKIHDAAGTDLNMAGGDTVTANGTVAPGQSPGILAVTGNFTFADNSTFEVEIGGTAPGNAATNHDQLDASGSVNIGTGVTLSLVDFNSFGATLTGGETFVIIQRGGGTGTFNGLAEGGTITGFLGTAFDATITYVGGDGNDVVLTVVNSNAPAVITLDNEVNDIQELRILNVSEKLADIVITDDGNGTNVVSLTGPDAAFFELKNGDTELHIKAGTMLDFETKPTYNVRVQVDDASLGGNPDSFVDFTVSVIDVPEPPEVDVTLGAVAVPAGGGVIFDDALQGGGAPQKTFTVTNSGISDLILQPINVPAGFTLTTPNFMPNQVLAPAASINFTVQMLTTAAGVKSGALTFATNDSTFAEQNYTINLSGAVIAPTTSPTTVTGGALLIDDGDAGYFAPGNWTTFSAGYNGDGQYARSTDGPDRAIWAFGGLAAGQFRVFITWQNGGDKSDDVIVTVRDGVGGTVLSTNHVAENVAPLNSRTEGGRKFQLLDTVAITGTDLVVELVDNGTGKPIVADAVLIESFTPPPATPEITVRDTGDLTDGGTFVFDSVIEGNARSVTFTVRNDGSADIILQPMTITGLAFSIRSGTNFTANQVLTPGDSVSFIVDVNTSTPGTFNGTLAIPSNDADENPFDLVLQATVNPIGASSFILDDGDSGFSLTDNWNSVTNYGYGADAKAIGTSNNGTATWTFTGLAPGEYLVSTTWLNGSDRADAVNYVIQDGSGGSVLSTVPINQKNAPTGDTYGGRKFQGLGSVTITGNTLVVVINNAGTNGAVIADAVRIESVTPPPNTPEIDVKQDTLTVLDNGSFNLGSANVGDPQLEKVFTVKNTGTANLTLEPISVTGTGFSLVGSNFTPGQVLAPNATATFTIGLSTATLGSFSGNVSFLNGDGDENPFNFGLSGSINVAPAAGVYILDDGDSGFSTTGIVTAVSTTAGYAGDLTVANSSNGDDTATWEFTGLAAGNYDVALTWQRGGDRATAVTYVIRDGIGGTVLDTVVIDQTQAPVGFTDNKRPFQILTNVAVTSSLVIEMSTAGTTGAVIIDAARIQLTS